ncbi:MAG: hypothetical protein NDI93_10080 [Pseudomonas sp.]|nr:hypothetical protein [Pseudomonas sp.]
MDKIAFFMENHCCHTRLNRSEKAMMTAQPNNKSLFSNEYFPSAGFSQQHAM